MQKITKWLAASVVFGLLSLATERADAIMEMSYTTDSANLLGTVFPGQVSPPGQAAHDAAMTNFLLGMGSQTHTSSNGSIYARTTWPGGAPATTAGAVTMNGFSDGTTAININLSQYGTFQYLVATYGDSDDPNGGVAVWNISGLTGTIQIYRYAKPQMMNGHFTGNLLGRNTAQPGCYLLTSWTLLSPTGVPDGGTTVMLLGTALGVLAVVRRYLLRSQADRPDF
jgi:VPDSG-CTERM motif